MRIIQRFGRIDRIGSTNARDPARQLLARHLARRVHQPQGARREPHGHRRPRGHRRRQRPHPGEQRHRVPQGAAPQPPGRGHRAGGRPHRRLDHRPRAQRLPHGPARLRQGVRRPRVITQGPARRRPRRPRHGLQARRRSSRCATSTTTQTSTGTTACTRYYLSTSTTTATSIADHTEVKHLLDLIRASCHGVARADPGGVPRLQRSARSEGADMARLLRPAHRGDPLPDRRHRGARHRQPLLRRQDHRARSRRFAGLDDFELIAFLAIVEPRADRWLSRPCSVARDGAFGRIIPKERLYAEASAGTALKQRFVDDVQRVTLGLQARRGVASACARHDAVHRDPGLRGRAQGRQTLDDSVLTAIDKAIPSPIIFELRREDGVTEQAMAAAHKRARRQEPKVSRYFRTDWSARSDAPRRRPARRARPARPLRGDSGAACCRSRMRAGRRTVGRHRQNGRVPQARARDRRAGEEAAHRTTAQPQDRAPQRRLKERTQCSPS